MAPTDTTTTALRKLQRRDPSEFGALMAATGVASALEPRMLGAPNAFHWPALFETDDPGNAEDVLNAVHDVLAPFVRANAFAPPEALFRHAAGRGVHRAEPSSWSAIGLPAQAAYTVFADTLQAIDRLREEAEARAPRKAPAASADDGRIPIEDSILVAGGAASDRVSYAEERSVTITPGTGEVPGRQTLPRPTPPGPPIGPDNTATTPTFFPRAPSQDRSGHGAPGPAAPTVPPPPAASGELGHGFDPDVPFTARGAPPAGLAPAPAEETIGASAAVAAAPADPRPAPDAPADLPGKDSDGGETAETNGQTVPAGPRAPMGGTNEQDGGVRPRPDRSDGDGVGGSRGPVQPENPSRLREREAAPAASLSDPAASERSLVLTGTEDGERVPGALEGTDAEAGPRPRKAK